MKHRYTDYCTCFYYSTEKEVYFWDEMKNRLIGTAKAETSIQADIIMRDYVNKAPQGVICEMI